MSTPVHLQSVEAVMMVISFAFALVLLGICNAFTIEKVFTGRRTSSTLSMSSVVDKDTTLNIPRKIKRALRSIKDSATLTAKILTPEVDGKFKFQGLQGLVDFL
jgi:hypothetical protein